MSDINNLMNGLGSSYKIPPFSFLCAASKRQHERQHERDCDKKDSVSLENDVALRNASKKEKN